MSVFRFLAHHFFQHLTMFLLIFLLTFCAVVNGNSDAKRLYDDLMSSYNALIRPVRNVSDRVTVQLGVKLTQIVDVVSSHCLIN